MNKKILLFLFVIFFSSCYTCYDVKRQYEPFSCRFMVIEKSKDNRFLEFNGSDSKKKHVNFKIGQHWDIYDSVEVGDTLLKKTGETDLILIKKDTTLVFPLMCGGRPVE